jgi:hypothetical protein
MSSSAFTSIGAFMLAEQTDGLRNKEHEPDVRYVRREKRLLLLHKFIFHAKSRAGYWQRSFGYAV